ncbi:MAG: hypothetical protein KBD24_00220 [Candidatus Pacebacteria bacterium]|nr:hypothetical protein [Candidatus Paceibacterota bacterium]
MERGHLFNTLIAHRDDTPELIACMEETVTKLLANDTSSQKPGILLGKIQSGKTRAFLGIMALAFDNGYDVSIILTKGTKALVKQTVQRMEKDFAEFIASDLAEVFDIMFMPDNLTAYERNKKLIIVVKKEVNNMNKILQKLATVYPDLREKRILIIDDEADYASISFRKHQEAVEIGKISSQIDELRNIVREVDYLQVTATPYSLYLQPNNLDGESMEFLPKRPAFTVLVPVHNTYVGGKFYFEESEDETSIAYNVYEEVPVEEREVLKKPDARKLKLEDVLVSEKIDVLRRSLLNFVVGAAVRRMQQSEAGERPQKYAFVAHSEISRASHNWQAELIKAIVDGLAERVKHGDTSTIDKMIRSSYDNIAQSIQKLGGLRIPTYEELVRVVHTALADEHIMITVVNSDKDVEELLDSEGQLKLRNPMNVYVGGQILDRGVTIGNLIGFYYGRNPNKFQQDTVLQHSRMYGARPKADLAVTRFYTTRDIYEVMRRIHEFDTALREAFEQGSHDKGVYFIRKDVTGKLVPCSPNKLLLSSLATLRPHKRMLPVGFQSGYKTHIEQTVHEIDSVVDRWFQGKDKSYAVLVDLTEAVEVIGLIGKTLELNELYAWSWNTFISSLEHLSHRARNPDQLNKVWVVMREDKSLSRTKADGRFSDDPDGGSGRTARTEARDAAVDAPALMLIRQKGLKEDGWKDTPFWWPILMSPANTEAAVFAEDIVT